MKSSVPVERDGARIHDVRIGPEGEAFLVEPLDHPAETSPGVLFLHWYDPQATDGNRTQFVDEAVELAGEHGVVSILPQGRFPWAEPPTDADADAARIRAEVALYTSALETLSEHPNVDRRRIGLVGHDFGGMHGVLVAADDPRIAAAVLICATPRWADWFLPFWDVAGDRHDYLRTLAALDPITRVGDISPRPVCFQFARNDFYIAGMTGLEFQHAAGDPNELHAYDADHAMRDPQARADRAAFLGRALGWLPG